MCPHTSKERSKPLAESSRTKHFRKSSYTIPKGPPEEKHGEWTKASTNASWFRVTSILGWKSSTKGGKSTSTNAFEAKARLVQAYSFTWTRAHTQHNHVDGGGVGFGIDSKHLQEAKQVL